MSINISTSTSSNSVQHWCGEWFAPFPRLAAATLGALWLASVGDVAVAQTVEVSGELDVIIKEDFDHGRFEHDYFLRDPDGQKWYQLQFKQTAPGHLRSGQRVKVRGQPQGRKFQVEALSEEGTSTTPSSGGTPDAQLTDARKAVVLMVDLTNAKASTRYTKEQIAGQMYTNSLSVDGVYREASLGQTSFPADTDGNGQPDVFGPFAINYDNSTCDYYGWASAAEAAAQAAGINLSLYRHRVFVLPRYSELPACSWAGIANVGCGTFCRAWIAEGESGMVYAHELGHNLSMAHAGTDPENDGAINSEYGDYSDPMGLSPGWHVFNAGHIDQMGWYAGITGAVRTVAASGIYDLAAIGNYPMVSGAPAVLKIPKSDTGDFYYLSYRQPIGYDSSLSSTYTGGVNIHRYKGTGYGCTSHIKTLTGNGTFTDSANGITVSQTGIAGNNATVQVSFGCATATPTVALSPAKLAVRPGAAASISVTVTDRDGSGCAGTTFALGYSGAVAGSVAPASLTLAPGESGTATLAVSASAGEGSYPLAVSASDADGVEPQHGASGQGGATLVVDGTAPNVPAGLSGSLDRQGKVSLSWQASSDALSGVVGYIVYRNDTAIGQTTSASFTDGTTVAGTAYQYAVSARDGAGNASPASGKVSITAGSSKGRKK